MTKPQDIVAEIEALPMFRKSTTVGYQEWDWVHRPTVLALVRAALVRTPETLDADSDDFRDRHERAIRAHILEGPEDHRCDDLCSAAIIDRLVGKHPSNEYPLQPLYVAATPAPDPGAGPACTCPYTGGLAGNRGKSASCLVHGEQVRAELAAALAPSVEPPETA